MKRYRAYPGIIGWAMLMPAFIPYPILLFLVVTMLDRGVGASRVMFPYFFLGILIAPILSRFLWNTVTRTTLTLDEVDVAYEGFKFHPWNVLKLQHINVKVPWGAVQEVGWVGATNGPLFIKTTHGDVRFWVIFHDSVNAEIMQEIVKRAPHLKNAS